MDKMRFTRSDFYHCIFQPYNDAVKAGCYTKIDYSLWRTLRDWCCDPLWGDSQVQIQPVPGGYNLSLVDENRIVEPSIITMARTAAANFAKYIENHIDDISKMDLNRQYAVAKKIYNNEEEKESMKFNFDFGPVDSSVRMSLYGMAIKNASGTYVAYDSNSKQIMDVEIVNFDGADKFVYKMPAALKDIAVGDVIIHSRKPMFVQELHKDNRLKVLDVYDGEEKVIVPAVSPFGFNFVTKVVNFLGNLNTGADASNPFGNLGLMLALSNEGGNDMLPLMLLSGGGKMDMSNPLMLYALIGKGGNMNDMLPWMLMCGSSIQPTGCNGTCAGNCHCAE